LAEEIGFKAAYLSGGGLGYQLALSEALLSVTEIASAATAITRRSGLGLIVDGGVGFGDPVHATRMMWDLEQAGAAGVEIEDQVAPKRVSHHRGVEHLVPTGEMVAKIKAVVAARDDPDFIIIARTGGVKEGGFDHAIERAKAYRDAGADMIMMFPTTEDDWEKAPELLQTPMVAIEPFGRRTNEEWDQLGYQLVIDAFTAQVLAYETVRDAYTKGFNGEPSRSRTDLWRLYGELNVVAGLEELYEIERATTEPGT
jgi:methylisocitrate lyase